MKESGHMFTLPSILGAVGVIGSLTFGVSTVADMNKKENDDKML